MDELINMQNIQQSISELENLVSNSSNGELNISFTGHRKKMIMDFFDTSYEPLSFIGKTQISGIIEQVKTTLLEWSIKLEEEGIIGDENMRFSHEEKDTAQKNIHIENFNGVMGDVDNLGNLSTGNYNQNTTTINNKIDSKLDKLIEQINALDIQGKEQIIQEIEGNIENKEKLTQTLGQLMTRGSEVATIAPAIGELLGLLG